MATLRLLPSTYAVSNTSYLSVSNPANMYTNTDSDTYATVTNSRQATTTYYLYIRGFNFDAIPEGAIINSFTIKFKARESGLSTSTTYRPVLANNTATYSSMTSSGTVGTSASVISFSGTLAWDTMVNAGANFGIRVTVRRASQNTTGYAYIYGAEILVDYSMPVPCTVDTSINGNGTISPLGTTNTYEDREFILTITPDNLSDAIKVTNNGIDVSEELTPQGSETGSKSAVLGTYKLVSGSFSGSGASYFSGLVGKGHNGSTTTSNYYAGSSSTNAVFTYSMAITDIPSNAVITRVYVMVNGHAESTSQTNEYMCVQLKSGSTNLTSQLNFKSIGTSNTTQTLEATTLPTIAQLSNMVLECTLGYYGGAINGATVFVEYEIPLENPTYYTYTFTTSGSHTIVVTIGDDGGLYLKINNSWQKVSKVYKKINNVWVEQTDITNLFDSNTKYINKT